MLRNLPIENEKIKFVVSVLENDKRWVHEEFEVDNFNPHQDLKKILKYLDTFEPNEKCRITMDDTTLSGIFSTYSGVGVETVYDQYRVFDFFVKTYDETQNITCFLEYLTQIFQLIEYYKISSLTELVKYFGELKYPVLVFYYSKNIRKFEPDVWEMLVQQGITEGDSKTRKLVTLGVYVVEDVIMNGNNSFFLNLDESFVLHKNVRKYLGEYLQDLGYPSDVMFTPQRLYEVLNELDLVELMFLLVDLKKVGSKFLSKSEYDQTSVRIGREYMYVVFWF